MKSNHFISAFFYVMTYSFQRMEQCTPQHLVIGHTQVKDLERYQFPEKPDINFDLTVKSIKGGKANELAQLIKRELALAKVPLRISAVIWQNSIWKITISEVIDIVDDIGLFLKGYPFHRVAFPECLFVPEQEHLWNKVHQINNVLKEYNEKQGFDRYSLFKTAQQYSKSKGMHVVRQSSYREYNKAIARGEDGTGLGYYLDEGAPKRRYAQHIRMFHRYGFNTSPLDGKGFPDSRPSSKEEELNLLQMSITE